jgi:hypothetical protein
MLPRLLFIAYALLCAAALTWPGYAWLGNRIEPFVLGLPFSFAWVIAWVIASFFALLIFHRATERRGRS